jgi:hypothetical protein
MHSKSRTKTGSNMSDSGDLKSAHFNFLICFKVQIITMLICWKWAAMKKQIMTIGYDTIFANGLHSKTATKLSSYTMPSKIPQLSSGYLVTRH